MAPNTYQTYTELTPFDIFRSDMLRRSAMCTALIPRYPALEAVATDARTLVEQIDAHKAALQSAEDAATIANAIEDAEKLDIIEVYTEMRRTMHAKRYDIATILPHAPSSLGRLGVDSFTKRIELAISSLRALPESDPIRTAYCSSLEKELSEFKIADQTEDDARGARKTAQLAVTLYKAELSQAREVQLGTILTILKDREKVSMFTIPWRKSSRATSGEEGSVENG